MRRLYTHVGRAKCAATAGLDAGDELQPPLWFGGVEGANTEFSRRGWEKVLVVHYIFVLQSVLIFYYNFKFYYYGVGRFSPFFTSALAVEVCARWTALSQCGGEAVGGAESFDQMQRDW